MHNIASAERARNIAQNLRPSDISAYFDKVQAWVPQRLSGAALEQLQQHCGGRLDVRNWTPKWDREGRYRQRLQLNQPKPQALKQLSRIDGAHVNFVEVSLDWTFDDYHQLEEADWLIKQHWVKPWHGKQEVREAKSTRYWAQRGARNVPLSYSDKASRITGEEHCLHMDWRVVSYEAVQRIGIEEAEDLCGYDLPEFWQKRLLLYAVDERKLGRAYHRQMLGQRRRRPWITRGRKHRTWQYDIDCDQQRGYLIMKVYADGQTQQLLDMYRTLELKQCLIPIQIQSRLFSQAEAGGEDAVEAVQMGEYAKDGNTVLDSRLSHWQASGIRSNMWFGSIYHREERMRTHQLMNVE
jgi:hypothetical protein